MLAACVIGCTQMHDIKFGPTAERPAMWLQSGSESVVVHETPAISYLMQS